MSKGGRNEANDTVKLINEYLLEVKSDNAYNIIEKSIKYLEKFANFENIK